MYTVKRQVAYGRLKTMWATVSSFFSTFGRFSKEKGTLNETRKHVKRTEQHGVFENENYLKQIQNFSRVTPK